MSKTKIAIDKRKEKLDSKKVFKRDVATKMMEQSKKELIPYMKDKVKEISEKVNEILKKDNGLISTQIELLIGSRNISEIASSGVSKSLSSEELMIALEMYRQVIAKINEKIVYPPSIFTFCSFIGISTVTYNSYKSDPDRTEVIQMIEDYITGIQFTSSQMGKLKEITTIYGMKAIHGYYENPTPITIKNELTLDIDEIQKQVKALNKGKAIDVEYEE